MEFGKSVKQPLPFRQKENLHDSLVTCRSTLADKPAALGSLDKSDHGVVALLEEFGQLSDCGPAPACKACNTKKQLVLLGRQAI